jgi:PBP1b-binding outer membrane lipoprotein LpoB
MKRKLISIAILTSFIVLAGCEKDNYDQPGSKLSGTVNYNGTAVGVRSGATQLELWQYGYATRAKIPVNIAQDGTFTATLFDGNYKLVRLAGAPWQRQTDSLDVTVKGTTTFDVPVTPFYTLTNESFTVSGGTLNSSVKVNKIGTENITSLTLYVGVTNIVDANNNSQNTTLNAAALTDLTAAKTQSITLNATNMAKSYLYVRIGVLCAGSTERFYTPVQKISLQ